MKLPKKLNKPPIVDSIFEIRFESLYPLDIVPGLITKLLMPLNLKDIKQFPILQFPEQIRKIDANFKYAPYYRANIDTFVVQFGPRMISLASPIPYIGWENFIPMISKVIEEILKSQLVTKIERLGQRGINFFENDILGNSNIIITNPISLEKTQYQYIDYYKKDEINIKTLIANKAQYQSNDIVKIGSVIDIDSSIEDGINSNHGAVINLVEKLHLAGKSVFFEILKSDFIDTMEPEYDSKIS
ncbi:MAG: hypothetical protein HW406_1608 [Candidatus Brocadiaceae bacterium]|nr:hypothetical protein [Candidatus Brocadiaceae bacterium]